jgi:P27 family predicted phage terminase small subunit
VQGNPGHRPLNTQQPKPKTPVKKARGMQPLARKFWDEYAPEMERLQILTGVDSAAFRLMAEHFGFAVQAAKQLQEAGLTVETKEGTKKNPLAQIFKDNSLAFRAFASEFGMTPSSRTRLKMPAEAEQLSLAEQLFQAVVQVVDADTSS